LGASEVVESLLEIVGGECAEDLDQSCQDEALALLLGSISCRAVQTARDFPVHFCGKDVPLLRRHPGWSKRLDQQGTPA
jgi:hypothetical protein